MFYNLQEVKDLKGLVRAAKQDEKKKELQSQLDKTIARRDLALAKRVMPKLIRIFIHVMYMYMYNYKWIIDIDTC